MKVYLIECIFVIYIADLFSKISYYLHCLVCSKTYYISTVKTKKCIEPERQTHTPNAKGSLSCQSIHVKKTIEYNEPLIAYKESHVKP